MQFITGLIGESGTTLLTSVLALVAVLALAVLGLWLLKLTMKGTSTLGRSRNRRLGVVEQLQIDARRQVLIIRRDDVEHVIMTGGGQDVVVETGIPVVRANPAPPPAPRAKLPEPSGGEIVPPVPAPPRAGARIKEMTRAAALRQSGSLRHTGLMRQRTATEPEVIPMPPATGDNSGQRPLDSATSPAGTADNGRSGIGSARDYSSTGRADGR
jgi:flagellar protein FliO/FliZ